MWLVKVNMSSLFSSWTSTPLEIIAPYYSEGSCSLGKTDDIFMINPDFGNQSQREKSELSLLFWAVFLHLIWICGHSKPHTTASLTAEQLYGRLLECGHLATWWHFMPSNSVGPLSTALKVWNSNRKRKKQDLLEWHRHHCQKAESSMRKSVSVCYFPQF